MASAATTHQICAVRKCKTPAAAVQRVHLSQPLGLLSKNIHGVSMNPLLCGSSPRLYVPTRPLLCPLSATGQVGGAANSEGGTFQLGKAILNFINSNLLPVALVGGVLCGFLNPSLGILAQQYNVLKFGTFGIFFISGLGLKTKELSAAMEAWPVGLLGLSSILVLTPLMSRLILQLPLTPPEFATGLAIFSCVPTTLSTGVTLTQIVGGSSALALAMTVVSNLLGIVTVPLTLSMHIGAGSGISLPTEQLFKSLISTLLVPVVLGKILREASTGIAEYVDKNRRMFAVINAMLISLFPWTQVSRSRSLLLSVKAEAFALAVGAGIFLHLMLLAVNAISLRILSAVSGGKDSIFAKKEYTRAVILVASQKTLPVTIAVVDQLAGALGESAMLVLPCIAAHINQIMLDSWIVSWWRQKDQTNPA